MEPAQEWYEEAVRARARIADYALKTPLLHETSAAGPQKTRLFYKLENEQVTGSFKARGALNKLASLSGQARERGIVTASTGNHARAVAYALSVLPGFEAVPAMIYLPRSVAPSKLAALHKTGVPLSIVQGDDCVHAEAAAATAAEESGAVFVSPYNDAQVIGGQGTAGLEIMDQLESIDRMYCARFGPSSVPLKPLIVIVPVGGGGLIAGVAAAVKGPSRPAGTVVIIGVQPATNACVYESVRQGRLLMERETGPDGLDLWLNGDTLADGTAGGVETGSTTWQAFQGSGADMVSLARAIGSARAAVARANASIGSIAGAGAGASAPFSPSKSGVQGKHHKAPLVDVVLTVTEEAIATAVAYMLQVNGKVVEGAAGCAVAASRDPRLSALWQECDVVALCCGGNIAETKLRHCLDVALAAQRGGK